MRALLMLLCFAFAGLNIWVIADGTGGVVNYVAAALCLCSGLYSMFSLVQYP